MAEQKSENRKRAKKKKAKSSKRPVNDKEFCGLIMPISALDGCSEQHWIDVREILEDAVNEAGFEARLVSDADESGIIQKRIIQNVYEDPIVVCDVSGKNPNVMFELGMRLAFDKPTIIIKDDKTSYTFDTAPIEHLEYPRDLRFAKIVEFQESLAAKLAATHKKAQTDRNYTTFLKNFGSFSVAKLETKALDKDEFILEELRALKSVLLRQNRVEESNYISTNAADYPNGQRRFIRVAVRRALLRLRKTQHRGDLRKAVLDLVLELERSRLTRYFKSQSEVERAVDRELGFFGLGKAQQS